MIRDLELMRDITPLFEKMLVVWGIEPKGRWVTEELKAMGAGNKGIFLCDCNQDLWGEEVCREKVLSPEILQSELECVDLKNVIILIMATDAEIQDEILGKIEVLYGDSVDVYTEYAVEWGIYYNIRDSHMQESFRKNKLIEHEMNRKLRNEVVRQISVASKYFSFLPLHNDEIILIYQPGKVASSSVYRSIRNYNRYVLHTHQLSEIDYDDNRLYDLLQLKTGKIISLVREPIARQISNMWQNVSSVNRYSVDADFSEIEEFYFKEGFENLQFDWFRREMKAVFQIDIFEHPFDVEKGYTIIKEGNIELLLMKMEKLSELKSVIGEFLGIESFQIENRNISSNKPYRFAMKDYRQSFSISEERLLDIYMKNEKVKHFYSEEERKSFYQKWLRKEQV